MRLGPDGFLGAVLAAEGCGAKAMINGPGGCRSRTLNLWRELSIEYGGEESGCCRSKYLSRQSHLPCTYLNSDDMVLGSGNKMTDGLRSVSSASSEDIVLIDTLGASLQVADRGKAVRDSGTEGRTVLSDDDLSALSMAEGFDRTVSALVRNAGLGKGERKGHVSILGYSLADSCWNYGKENISRLLALMDVETDSFVGCGSSKAEISSSGMSEAVVLLHPEMSAETSEVYRSAGCGTVVPRKGAPIGFPAIRSFLEDVADATGTSPDHALEAVDAEEERIFRILRNCDKDSRAFRGLCCALKGMPSDTLPLMEWMYGLFGMVPSSVEKAYCGGSVYDAGISHFLEETDCSGALGRKVGGRGLAAVFTDGLGAEEYKALHPEVACIGISMPYARKGEFMDRSLVGLGGCRYLLDSLINGCGEFRCGQPTMADFR